MKMTQKEKKILMQELIGAEIRIEDATDPHLKNLAGIIINETKNMLIISEKETRKNKKIPKRTGIFQIKLKNGMKIRVNGKRLINRPEDRLKKMKKSR
ncbi:MAG: ribonuclease P component 1 family protein [Candidatus Helarchaeota archaeon]